jgi:hypothetical protein
MQDPCCWDLAFQTIPGPAGSRGIQGIQGERGPPGIAGPGAIVPYSSGGGLTLTLTVGYSFALPRAGTPVGLSATFVVTTDVDLSSVADPSLRVRVFFRPVGFITFNLYSESVLTLPLPMSPITTAYVVSGSVAFADPALLIDFDSSLIAQTPVALVGTLAAGLSIA